MIWASAPRRFFLSPEFLREKVFPWHKRCDEVAHDKGRSYLLHSCGQLESVMDDLIDEIGIDAKHSYEDTILPVTEAKKKYGDRITILGGIDMDFLCRSSEREIRKWVCETLKICMAGGGYCLGAGNTIANYIPLENYLVMLDVGRLLG